jgi:hypothetical protein
MCSAGLAAEGQRQTGNDEPVFQSRDAHLTLRPSRLKCLTICAVGVGGAALSLLMAADPSSSSAQTFWGWVGLIVCAAGAIMAPIQLLPGVELHLDRTGFTVRTPWRRRRYAWSDVRGSFQARRVRRVSFVAFNVAGPRSLADKLNSPLLAAWTRRCPTPMDFPPTSWLG